MKKKEIGFPNVCGPSHLLKIIMSQPILNHVLKVITTPGPLSLQLQQTYCSFLAQNYYINSQTAVSRTLS